jgi:hypothetical protein
MRIDEHDFEYTAKAVYIMNVSVRESYDSWEDLREFMISMAYAYCHKSNSFSTSGFNLTAYASPDGKERVVRASVMGYVACQYAERTQRIKELARVL